MQNTLNKLWYDNNKWSCLLLPFSWLYRFVVSLRRLSYSIGIFKKNQFPVPIIVVGNLTVGGTGKTPMVIWLVNWLREQGYRVGVVSRGYGGKTSHQPTVVTKDASPKIVGDEPYLIAKKTNCPVVVHPNRSEAVKTLLKQFCCDIVLCDDGLQHYAVERDIEVLIVDGLRRFGNRHCLPAGPLREPISRLKQADFVVINCNSSNASDEPNDAASFQMTVFPSKARSVAEMSLKRDLQSFQGNVVHAVAGIGNPQRFFQLLRQIGLNIIEHSFPDHYQFSLDDINFGNDALVMMTEKDAVKCQAFADDRHWCLPIEVKMESRFVSELSQKLAAIFSAEVA